MELNKYSDITQEKLILTRRELQPVVALTSKLTT